MKKFYLILLSLSVLLFSGCSKGVNALNPFQEEKKVYGFSFINGTVVEVFGNNVIIEIEDRDVVVGNSYEDKLTNKIIKSSMLIPGMKTFIGKETAYVKDVRINQITFSLDKTNLSKDQSVKIFIPKKTIAIMDFSLIGMSSSTMNKFAMEDMTTKMVQSGQYVVVERNKIDTILKEHKLADSGLMDKKSASKIGKLVSANIILTGSFAKKSNQWNVNLRLVDVSTGIIISAINDKIDLSEFRPKQSLDSSNITITFEDNQFTNHWLKNILNKKGAKSKISIDSSNGANQTNKSYKIDYFFPKQKSISVFFNKRLRDVSSYQGIKFFAKSEGSTVLGLSVNDQNYDNAYINRWNTLINISSNWKEYKIPFNELVLSKLYERNNPGGDGKFDLDNIESIAFWVKGKFNTTNERKSMWIDEISFY